MSYQIQYNDFPTFLRKHFPYKVQKISLNAGFTCPNRDGTKGWGMNELVEAMQRAAESINQAEKMKDGQQITIPSKKQTAKNEGSDSKAVQSSSGKININTAGVKELMTLSGIGEAKASDIISYREEHGPFSDISDIMKIQGIKEGIYHKIKNKITI